MSAQINANVLKNFIVKTIGADKLAHDRAQGFNINNDKFENANENDNNYLEIRGKLIKHLQDDNYNYVIFEITDNIYLQEVILKAVKNHNKFEIENNLNDKELLFTKMIRDTDKIDIYKKFSWGLF